MARCQRDKLIAAAEEEGIGGDEQPVDSSPHRALPSRLSTVTRHPDTTGSPAAGLQLDKGCKSPVEITFASGVHDMPRSARK